MLLLQARPFFGESFVTSAVNIKEGRSQGLLVQHDAVKYFSQPSNSVLMTNVLTAVELARRMQNKREMHR